MGGRGYGLLPRLVLLLFIVEKSYSAAITSTKPPKLQNL